MKFNKKQTKNKETNKNSYCKKFISLVRTTYNIFTNKTEVIQKERTLVSNKFLNERDYTQRIAISSLKLNKICISLNYMSSIISPF